MGQLTMRNLSWKLIGNGPYPDVNLLLLVRVSWYSKFCHIQQKKRGFSFWKSVWILSFPPKTLLLSLIPHLWKSREADSTGIDKWGKLVVLARPCCFVLLISSNSFGCTLSWISWWYSTKCEFLWKPPYERFQIWKTYPNYPLKKAPKVEM